MKHSIFFLALCLTFDAWAGVYKCTDAAGKTFYQSSPCADVSQAAEMNTKTGGSTDLIAEEKKKAQELELKKQQEMQAQGQQQAQLQAIADRKQLAQAESALTQTLIKQNPQQFSAYAIPSYDPEKLPDLVRIYEERLPDIEKFRRLAAQKALASGKCQRVEADELSNKSSKEHLVFMVNCSSGNFYFNEAELK